MRSLRDPSALSRCALGVALAAALLLSTAPARAASSGTSSGVHFVINNVDDPGVGLNDPTPVQPVGGNTGTTLGEQRRIALRYALDIWESYLEGDVEVVVQVRFEALTCTATSLTLARTRPLRVVADFPGAPRRGTWYPVALANQLAGEDLFPGPPDPAAELPEPSDDVLIRFNLRPDSDPTCMPPTWYYGLDGQSGADYSFVRSALHELPHGLGFNNLVDEQTGAYTAGDMPDIFTTRVYDNYQRLGWPEMTDAERALSARSCGQVVWTGENANRTAPAFLDSGHPHVDVLTPDHSPWEAQVGTANYGPPLDSTGVSGRLVLVDDGAGVPTDACSPLTAASAEQVKGNVALVDRGACAFVTKTINAENAGAVGVIVADTVAACPVNNIVGTAGVDIPTVRVSLLDGNRMKESLPWVWVELEVDPTRPIATDRRERLQLFAEGEPSGISTIIHWDPKATPNLLMEVDPGYRGEVPLDPDLTPYQLTDVGWELVTVTLDGCDTRVANAALPDGHRVEELAEACFLQSTARSQNKRCLFDAADLLRRSGLASGYQAARWRSCSAQATR